MRLQRPRVAEITRWVPFATSCGVGMRCSRPGTTRRNIELEPGYWRMSADALDIRRCPDASVNCSSSGNATCAHSTSGCRGGTNQSTYCAATLTGPFCKLCAEQQHAKRVYYDAASTDHVARCKSCDDVFSNIAGRTIAVFVAVLLVLLLCTIVLARRLPRDTVFQLTRFRKATHPETKLKILCMARGRL
jgi:hypothetical protein